jgi:hypothetical protein
MNLLCRLGIHRWKEERVLECRLTCATAWLEGDVCQRCEALRDPESFASVYATMALMRGEIIAHPSRSAAGGEE